MFPDVRERLLPVEVVGAAAKSDALFTVLDAGAPGFPLAVFAAIGLFAVVNSALINMLMASRLLYGMANERIIPRPFGRVHQNRRTPWCPSCSPAPSRSSS